MGPDAAGDAPLQQQGVQPSAVLESDRGEPSGVDETAIAVQRKGSRAIRIDDDGDDLADAGACAVGEQPVQQPSTDTATDDMPTAARCGVCTTWPH